MNSAPGQLEMAEAVESALGEKKHLLVEAGTGTGKTLAYLVPAILSGKRVVVSTGTKNLAGAAFLQGHSVSAETFRAAAAGLLHEGPRQFRLPPEDLRRRAEPILAGLEEVADFQIIREWEKTTATGDRAEIKTLPESSSAWQKIDARRELVHRPEVPAVRALLHHADAPARARERHHHRQSPPVLRRPGGEGRGVRRDHSRVCCRGFRRGARDRRRRRTVLRRRRQQLSVPGTGSRHRRGVARASSSDRESWTAC